MANQGEPLPDNQPVQHIGHADVINAARVLMLFGAAAAVSATVGSTGADDDAGQAFLVLVAWLLGVCLLLLSAAGGQFPQADALAGAAVANASAVLRRLFTPWEWD
ncbi:unnamed protein product [Urochloa decumbens]|uniref:Uncharacterized protein n=1 Tax=Urochloa decumbens TaxID=240449 RepID=A0ABC9E2Q9_9POAL